MSAEASIIVITTETTDAKNMNPTRHRLFWPLMCVALAACQPGGEQNASAGAKPGASIPGPSVETDIAAIRQLQQNWNAAVEAGSVDGYLAVLDDGIELLPTSAPPINGKDGYRAMLEGVFGANSYEIEVVDQGDVMVDRDMAWARYDYIIHRTPHAADAGSAPASHEPTTVSSHGKYLDVMRRQPDGSWRVYKHIWNYNEPGVVP